MIDFNTIMNAVFEQALKPLNDKIEAQDKRIADLEEFIARWNFGDKEKFDEAVKTVAQDVCVQYVDASEERMYDRIENVVSEKMDELDVDDAVEKALDNKNWGRELRDIIAEEVEKQTENIDLEDTVRDILKNATITAEISI